MKSVMKEQSSLGQWLGEKCHREHLSLRQAAARTGLSHATIRDIIKGNCPSPETIKKLAECFSASGDHHKLSLEDHLLILAGYRTPRPEGEEISEALAQLLDKVSKFNDSQLSIMTRFADFLMEIEGED